MDLLNFPHLSYLYFDISPLSNFSLFCIFIPQCPLQSATCEKAEIRVCDAKSMVKFVVGEGAGEEQTATSLQSQILDIKRPQ